MVEGTYYRLSDTSLSIVILDVAHHPVSIAVSSGDTLEESATTQYAPLHTAIRKARTHGAIGYCFCSECNWKIDHIDRYCRKCGAMFIATEWGCDDERA